MNSSEKLQLTLLAFTANRLNEGYADLHFKVNKLDLKCVGESNIGGMLEIIDTLITDMMEERGLEFEQVIELLSAVRAVTLDKEVIRE